MSDEGIHSRAGQAKVELDLTDKAFSDMRANAIEAWSRTKDHETQLREALYRSVVVIDTVQKHLRSVVQSAEVADFAESIREQLATASE